MSRASDLDAEFAALAEGKPPTPRYYPGSSRPLGKSPGMPREDKDSKGVREWDTKPMIFEDPVTKKDAEFFTIGNLADALGRESGTIRKWENTGVIPKAAFLTPGEDPRGRRRLYSRAQIEGLVRIAAEEKILVNPDNRPISRTAFKERAWELFASLKGQA